MKALKFIGMALSAVILCVSIAACSKKANDGSFPESLEGTEWTGTDPYGYTINVTVGTMTCVIDVDDPDGLDYYTIEGPYSYDSETGQFTVNYDDMLISGQVTGNTLTVDFLGDTITLRKK